MWALLYVCSFRQSKAYLGPSCGSADHRCSADASGLCSFESTKKYILRTLELTITNYSDNWLLMEADSNLIQAQSRRVTRDLDLS